MLAVDGASSSEHVSVDSNSCDARPIGDVRAEHSKKFYIYTERGDFRREFGSRYNEENTKRAKESKRTVHENVRRANNVRRYGIAFRSSSRTARYRQAHPDDFGERPELQGSRGFEKQLGQGGYKIHSIGEPRNRWLKIT